MKSNLITGLGAVFDVPNTLGVGFLEKVFGCLADILVEDVLVLELKYVERLGPEHMAQCLKLAAGFRVDVLLVGQFSETEGGMEEGRL